MILLTVGDTFKLGSTAWQDSKKIDCLMESMHDKAPPPPF